MPRVRVEISKRWYSCTCAEHGTKSVMGKKQTRAVDHSARGSMKNAANCATRRELQDANFVGSNAPCGPGLHSPATSVRGSETNSSPAVRLPPFGVRRRSACGLGPRRPAELLRGRCQRASGPQVGLRFGVPVAWRMGAGAAAQAGRSAHLRCGPGPLVAARFTGPSSRPVSSLNIDLGSGESTRST